jgi:glycosyltransferase involved in cell wall biosynthesis
VSFNKIDGDSGYGGMLDMLTHGRGGADDFWGYMTVQNGAFGVERDMPSWLFQVADYPQHGRAQMSVIPRDFRTRFGVACGVMPVDLVVTQRGQAIPGMRGDLVDPRYEGVEVPIGLYDLTSGGRNDAVDVGTSTCEQMKAFGYGSASYRMFLSDHGKEAAFSLMRKHLSFDLIRKAEKTSYVWGGISEHYVREAAKQYEARPRAERFTVAYGGRANPNKRWDLIADIMELFASSGRKVRNVMSTQSSAFGKGIDVHKLWPSIEFYASRGYQQYYDLIMDADVLLYASKIEEYPAAVGEAAFIGLTVVLPRKEWAFEVVGEDYPFLWSTKAEAFAHLAWIYDHRGSQQLKDLRDRTREKVKAMGTDKLGLEHSVIRMWETLRAQVDDSTTAAVKRIPNALRELMYETVRGMPEQFSLDEFWKTFVESKDIPADDPFGKSHPTMWSGYKLLTTIEDLKDVGGIKPVFRKEKRDESVG